MVRFICLAAIIVGRVQVPVCTDMEDGAIKPRDLPG